MLEANLTNKKETNVTGLFQWDYGQIVKVIGIEDTSNLEIHIGNDSSETYMVKSITVEDGYFTFQIPDSLLQTAHTIKAYIYHDSGKEGKSRKLIRFSIGDRTKPEDYITPDDENYKYIVPKGGTAGQVLVKKSDADGDSEWGDVGGVSSFNINSLTEENDLSDSDYLALYDTSATAHRKTLWSNIKAKLKANFDTLYSAIGHTHTKANIIDFDDSDYASAEHTHDDRYYTETEVNTLLSGKSDTNHNHNDVYQAKETGKGLSSNDYTTEEKNKLFNLSNYDDTEVRGLIGGKVDKVTGKGLSANDFTNALKTKLEGIAEGAEVNVNADWNQTDTGADDYIKNKPVIPPTVTVDTVMSDTSINPVQNKIIKAYVDDLVGDIETLLGGI